MRNRRGNLKRNKTFTVIFLGIGYYLPTNIMYIVLILTDTNTQFWKLAKKGESWFRKMFHPIFTTYILYTTCPTKLNVVSYHRTGEGLPIQGCLRLLLRPNDSKVTKRHAKILTIERQPTTWVWTWIFSLRWLSQLKFWSSLLKNMAARTQPSVS